MSQLYSSSPQTSSSERINTSYAFLVHSQDTLPNNLPPCVDNKPLARQRRRRTRRVFTQPNNTTTPHWPSEGKRSSGDSMTNTTNSPEDQAVLEAEFKRDPKPDKAARQRIVERVALGDKEVQIWFQNRRQTSRRKSRPLDPSETWDMHGHNEHDNTIPSSDAPSSSAVESPALMSSSPRLAAGSSPAASVDMTAHTSNATEMSLAGSMLTSAEIKRDPSTSFGLQTDAAQGKIISSQELLESTSMNSQAAMNVPSTGSATASKPDSTATGRSLKRSSSTVRLSLASDYTAKIMQPDEASPSPPKVQRYVDMLADSPNPVPRNGLRRSCSVAGLAESSLLGSRSSRATRVGRSRDSRAWEFWCDRDARTDLMKVADQETRGSAADAISLIRSNSQRAVLSPLAIDPHDGQDGGRSLKRVKSSHYGDDRGHQRQQRREPRAKLERSRTSVGRIEGHHNFGKTPAGKAAKRDSGIGMDADLDIYEDVSSSEGAAKRPRPRSSSFGSLPASESDKENLDPEEEDSWMRHKGGFKAGGKRKQRAPVPALRGSLTAPLASSRRFGSSSQTANSKDPQRRRYRMAKHGWNGAAADAENAESRLVDEDDEVAAFMAGGRSVSATVADASGSGRRDEDDMDCVQGLLSLSQGAWR